MISEESIDGFRQLFLDALDRRNFHECEVILEIADEFPLPALRHARQHYTGVLLYEKRQYDQAESILRTLLDQPLSQQQRTKTCLELAISLDELGQWLEAESFYQAAIDGYRIAENTLGLARTYNNLGIMFTCQVEQGLAVSDRLNKALYYHQEAIQLLETLNKTPEAQEEIIKNLHGMGRAYAFQQAYPLAKITFDRFLACCQGEAHTYQRAMGLSDMAALLLQPQGQIAEATTALVTAIELFSTKEDDLHLAEALTRYGNLLEQQNQTANALHAYEQALTHAESIRNRLQASTAKTEYRTTIEDAYTAPLSLHLRQGNAMQAFTMAERSRSRVLADLLSNQKAKPRQIGVIELDQQRKLLQQALETAYNNAAEQANVQSLEQQLASIDRQIDILDPEFAALESVASLDARQVQAQLPPDATLLTYVSDNQGQLWALCMSSNQAHLVPLPQPKLSWLQTVLVEYLEGKRPGLTPDRNKRLAPLKLFSQLYQHLIAPVWSYLAAARTVYIIPSGPLYYLPLGALAPEGGQPPLLAAGRRVVYAPSATVLFTYCHQCRPSPYDSVLAVAPTYQEPTEHLQFSQGAATAIANLARDVSLVGDKASREALLSMAGNQRVLCFLGHAFFNWRYPMLSHLKLCDGLLQASEILRELRLQTDLVVLAACETGRTKILRGDEILGLSRAMFYAGTPSLLVTLWPVHEIPTRLLIEHFFHQLGLNDGQTRPIDPAASLTVAQNWLRTLTYVEAHHLLVQWQTVTSQSAQTELLQLWQMTHSNIPLQEDSRIFEHPFFWSPYILIGEPAPDKGNKPPVE